MDILMAVEVMDIHMALVPEVLVIMAIHIVGEQVMLIVILMVIPFQQRHHLQVGIVLQLTIPICKVDILKFR